MRSLAVFALVVAGCAHDPSTFMPRAAPGDDRIVVAEFCVAWEEPCRRFQRQILTDPDVQQALTRVRFVQFDLTTIKGSAAYEHFEQSALVGAPYGAARVARLLVFLGIVDNRPVRRYAGPKFDAAAFVRFLDESAPLGGSERALQDALTAAPDDPRTLARAGAWYDGHARRADGKRYWDRLAARTDAPAELRATGAWHGGATERRGRPAQLGELLRFAEAHAGTTWALHAMDAAAASQRLPNADLAAVLRVSFERARDDIDAVATLTWTALGANLLDDALTIAERGVQLTHGASARELAAVAQVHLARDERPQAIDALLLALQLQPGDPLMTAELDNARHRGGVFYDRLETWRTAAMRWSALFFGVE